MIRMISIIHNLSGITLFSKVFEGFCKNIDNKLSADLIGGFISALKKFSQEFGQDEIKQIEMSTLKFLIYEKEGLLIFYVVDDTDDMEIYKKSLVMCLKSFLKMFSKSDFLNYHEVSVFRKFNLIINEILKIAPEKIEPSCLNCPMGQKKDCLFKQVQQQISLYKKQ